MDVGRRARLLASCVRLGVALCGSLAGATPPLAAAPVRMVPVAASDARPPVPARPVAVAASAVGLPEPPGLASPQCDGLVGELRLACIERTVSWRR